MRKRNFLVLSFGAAAFLFLFKKVSKQREIAKYIVPDVQKGESRGKRRFIFSIIFSLGLIFVAAAAVYFWQNENAERNEVAQTHIVERTQRDVLLEELRILILREQGLRNSYNDLQKIVTELHDKTRELKNTYDEKQRDVNALESQKTFLRNEINLLETRTGELQAQVDAIGAYLIQLQEGIAGIEQEIARLESELE